MTAVMHIRGQTVYGLREPVYVFLRLTQQMERKPHGTSSTDPWKGTDGIHSVLQRF